MPEHNTDQQEEVDALWQGVRAGDARSARLLIEYLLASGDEENVEAAHRAITRYFRRQARQIARRARLARGESRQALTDEAIRAFTKALVAEHLPQLTQDALARAADINRSASAQTNLLPDALPPPVILKAVGKDRAVELQWLPPAGILLTSQTIKYYIDGTEAGTKTPTTIDTTYTIPDLTNGQTYRFVIEVTALLQTSSAEILATAGAASASLPSPTDLKATGKAGGIDFSWKQTRPVGGISITKFLLTLTGGDSTRTAEQNYSTSEIFTRSFTGLENGTLYSLNLQTLGRGGDLSALLSKAVTIDAVAGLTAGSFIPQLPQLPADPLPFLDPDLPVELLRDKRLLNQAIAIGQKWRFEYLKEQSVRAAHDALAYDRQIMDFMSMTLTKGVGAGSLFTPVLLSAFDTLNNDAQAISNVARAPSVVEAIGELSNASAAALMMAALLRWLAKMDAFQLWTGLFNALLKDVSKADTSLKRVKGFFEDQYESSNGKFGKAVRDMARAEVDLVAAEVSRLIQPLHNAVAQIVGGASKNMGEVFESFDLPLLMGSGFDDAALVKKGVALDIDIPNVNPLLTTLARLEDSVKELEYALQRQVQETLIQVAEGNAKRWFRDLMMAYLVAPLVAALAVSLAGGPASAALLAAVVVVAAEQLLKLIARWLQGPLGDVLDELNQEVADATANFQRTLSYEIPLSSLYGSADELKMLRDELRQLRDLLPQPFLIDLANLLGDARDLTLADGVVQALAAERALGISNATAFDRILYSYGGYFTAADQMPGGSDSALFAGAALLRDLKLLEQDMVRLTDGKEVEITRRFSLFQLLGGTGDPLTATGPALGRFQDFISNGRAIIELRPEALLDSYTPGVYRALIKDVKVSGIARGAIVGDALFTAGFAVTLTHDGTSRTRIKRDSNLTAPPIALPPGLPDREAYVLAATYRHLSPLPKRPFSPNSAEGAVWSVISNTKERRTNTGGINWSVLRRVLLKELPSAIGELGNIRTAIRARAFASDSLSGFGPENAIDDDRNTYYSSLPGAQNQQHTLTVELNERASAITGVWLWPRVNSEGNPIGFPTDFTLQVSDDDVNYDAIPYVRRDDLTPGKQAYYFHSSAFSGRYIRLNAVAQGLVEPEKYALQLCNLQVELMNGMFVPVTLPQSLAKGNTTIAGHEPSKLVDKDLQTYFDGGSFLNQPTPGLDPFFIVKPEASPMSVSRIRIYPKQQDPLGGFPRSFGFFMYYYESIFDFQNYVLRNHAPQDFYIPTIGADSFGLQGRELDLKEGKYIFQIAEVEVSTFIPSLTLIDSSPVRSVVETILREMIWPPDIVLNEEPQRQVEQIAIHVANQLCSGLSNKGIPGLAVMAERAWDATYDNLMGHIAKWGDASQEEDPDPNIRGLHYVNLVRKVNPEAATFDLFPADNASLPSGTYLQAQPVDKQAASLQYRPFENLGLGGQIQIDVPQSARTLLADILIEITMRGCFDPDLAAAVSAGQQQRHEQLTRVANIGKVQIPPQNLILGSPTVKVSTGGLRSVQFSLRTQRDRIMQAALAGAQIMGFTNQKPHISVDGLKFKPHEVAALNLNDPVSFFSTLDQQPTSITLKFAKDSTPTLLDQQAQFVISPETLGVDLDLLDNELPLLNSQFRPALVGIAVVIIPTRHAVDKFREPEFNVRATTVDDKLQPLLGWEPQQIVPSLLTMTSLEQAANEVDMSELWASTRNLTLDFGEAIKQGFLYDVIFSLSFRVPVLTGVTTAPDLF